MKKLLKTLDKVLIFATFLAGLLSLFVTEEKEVGFILLALGNLYLIKVIVERIESKIDNLDVTATIKGIDLDRVVERYRGRGE